MPEDSKNKLAGMIALKQKDVVKSAPKPDAPAPSRPKEPPKPKAMDKLMAAKGQVKKVEKPSAPARPAPAKAGPSVTQKPEDARPGAKGVSSASAPRSSEKPAPSPRKKAIAPRKPKGPGILTQMLAGLKVHIREEIQEIKKELAAQHLFKPFRDGINSMKKGVTYLKARISEDRSEAGDGLKSPYADIQAGKLKAYDRSDPTGDIAAVVDERREAKVFGEALVQLGSMRQRQAPRRASGSSLDEPPSETGGVDPSWPVMTAPPPEQRADAVPLPPGGWQGGKVGAAGDIAPVTDERVRAAQVGAALEQMGSIRQRETASRQRVQGKDEPGPQAGTPVGSEGPSNEMGMAVSRQPSEGVSSPPVSDPAAVPSTDARAFEGFSTNPESPGGVSPPLEGGRRPPEDLTDLPPRAEAVPRPSAAQLPPATARGTGAAASSQTERRPSPEFFAPSAPGVTGDITPVVDEKRRAVQVGAALEQMGSIRQRQAGVGKPKPEVEQRAGAVPPNDAPTRAGAEGNVSPTPPSPPAQEAAPPDALSSRAPQTPGPPSAPAGGDPVPPSPEMRPGGEETLRPSAPPQASQAPMTADLQQSPPLEEQGQTLFQRLTQSGQKTKKRGGPQRKASKTEHQIRVIKALQTLFVHPLWRQVVVNPSEKPGQLYIPRKTFETHFAEAGFRNAMKAASRLAMSFPADIKDLTFDEPTIEDILRFEFPKVRGQENPDEKQIAEKCDKEMVSRIGRVVESDEVKRLVRSAGTRLGAFVPSVEIVARIYLGLKKGNDMNPTSRLDIQRDVMFKYQKARYPEKLARRARNVALRYFFEHLIDYGLELYKERKAAVLEMKIPEGDLEVRFEGLREVCCNLAAERASKAVLSMQVITELREQIRGAIGDYEMGVEHVAGGRAALTADEEGEEETEGPPKQAEGVSEGQPEAVPQA